MTPTDHTPHECTVHGCVRGHATCPVCDGGLARCVVCGRMELDLDEPCSGPGSTTGITPEPSGNLSLDQIVARNAIVAAIRRGDREGVLCGPAGAGKTHLVKAVVACLRGEGWDFRFLAPTGRAASVLGKVTGENVSTIHAALFRSVEERGDGRLLFGDPRVLCPERAVVVVDEATMVGRSLRQDLLRQVPGDSFVLWVGDPAQLEPVDEPWGPDFAHPVARLEVVHRQALDNPIRCITAELRAGRPLPHGEVGEAYTRRSGSLSGTAAEVHDLRASGVDVAVVTWTNAVRRRFCALSRRLAGATDETPVLPGDLLCVTRNNRVHARMNGEILRVRSVARWSDTVPGDVQASVFESGALQVRAEEGTPPFLVHPSLLGSSPGDWARAVHDHVTTSPYAWLAVDYGHAITVHRSQGSQYDHVFFLIDGALRDLAARDAETARRLAYVATTRAVRRLTVVDL